MIDVVVFARRVALGDHGLDGVGHAVQSFEARVLKDLQHVLAIATAVVLII